MLFAIHYQTRDAARNKSDTGALMKVFGERGEVEGTVAHYAYPGGGGIVIAEQADATTMYETLIAYGEWLDFDVRPIVAIDDAVPIILNYLGS